MEREWRNLGTKPNTNAAINESRLNGRISQKRAVRIVDKAVTGICGAETLGKNHRYRCNFELARDAKSNLILTKYRGFVSLLRRYIRSAK